MSRVAVMAGNFREAADWIKQNNLPVRSTGIISCSRDLVSLCGVDLHFIGSYKDNPMYDSDDLKYIRYMAKARKINFIGEVVDDEIQD